MFTVNDKVIRPILARELYGLIAARHDQPDMFLAGTGLFAHDLQNSQRLIAPSQLFRLVRQSRSLGAEDLPLQLGSRLLYSDEPLAKALLQTPNVYQGLRLLARYQALWAPQVLIRPAHSQQHIHLDFYCPLGRVDLARFFLLAASSFVYGWISEHKKIHLHWQLPLSETCSYAIFDQSIQSPSPLWRLNLPMADVITTKGSKAEPWLEECKGLLASLPRQHSLLMLAQRFLKPRPQATLNDLAKHLRISAATLKRRLKVEGTSFQQLQDSLRGQQALCLLTDQGWSNQKLADYFQISDVNNFRRAFKRWTGITPSDVKPA
ncbi:helix-turn-helix domain-containing protein [Simiduia curdlanivorans]|uniref:Helix-turn-helix domain-containing protein n=1 Tax=Simiduia curdlanivorans TaxID=1492769 RepID=A0ABV8VAS4_9GAMM|nr:AraC family transcriptional regulator [Simiduia curdlanivorans]MDN3639500.1 helix-turn-helix domain-containing protein [Simiduia curdlanivorans]